MTTDSKDALTDGSAMVEPAQDDDSSLLLQMHFAGEVRAEVQTNAVNALAEMIGTLAEEEYWRRVSPFVFQDARDVSVLNELLRFGIYTLGQAIDFTRLSMMAADTDLQKIESSVEYVKMLVKVSIAELEGDVSRHSSVDIDAWNAHVDRTYPDIQTVLLRVGELLGQILGHLIMCDCGNCVSAREAVVVEQDRIVTEYLVHNQQPVEYSQEEMSEEYIRSIQHYPREQRIRLWIIWRLLRDTMRAVNEMSIIIDGEYKWQPQSDYVIQSVRDLDEMRALRDRDRLTLTEALEATRPFISEISADEEGLESFIYMLLNHTLCVVAAREFEYLDDPYNISLANWNAYPDRTYFDVRVLFDRSYRLLGQLIGGLVKCPCVVCETSREFIDQELILLTVDYTDRSGHVSVQ